MASDRLDRRFRLFQSAVVCSDLADGVYKISVPLLALRLPSPAISVTVVGIAVRLPWLVATLPAGVIVDRYKPRKVMRLISAVRLPLIAVLCWFAVSGQLSLWLLALGAFLIGCIGTVLDVAAQSFLPYLVDTRQLSKANASLQSGQMFLAQLLGPSLGGYATSLGPGAGVAAAGGLYLVTVCALQLLPTTRAHNTAASEDLPTRTRPMRTVRAELTEGLSYFRERSDLLRLATSAAVNNLAYSMCFTILPLWAVRPGRLGLSAGGYGLLLTCLAVGSVASGLLATRVVGKIGRGPLLRFGAPVLGLCFLAIAVPSVPVVAISLICYGVVSMLWNVVVTSYRQESIPPHLFGRVNAAYRWLTWGVIPLGALFGGVLASTAGNQTAFVVAGSLPVAVGVLLLLTGRTAATMIELSAKPTSAGPSEYPNVDFHESVASMSFLHQLLTVKAIEDPSGIAAYYGDTCLTFADAERRADLVAASLIDLGVRPGSPVGLHMSRSLDLVPAIFGVLRSGAVCVPVDPEDPADRRATILSSSGAAVVLTERAFSGASYPAGVRVADMRDALDREPGALDTPVELTDDALAFIFYTSGSSGTPKGVMLTHRALLSGQRWLQRTFPLAPGDRQLLRTTLSITNLVREVFWPMLSGGAAVIVPPGGHKDPDQMVELINKAGVSTLMVVPALLDSMLENPAFAANTSLKYVFCSSDVMPGSLPAKYFATGLPARLFNVYGLTEALYCSYWECLPGAVYDGFVPVGFPAELEPRVLDSDLRPVPGGETGELCIAGVGIAEGYRGLPELTAEKFVSTPHGRVFRTGDLARTAADGRIDLLGRMDDQVKIAGYRVELGEVEARLREIPGVVNAVVSGRLTVNGHRRLVGQLTCEGEPPSAGAIRAHLAGRLPDYMIPSTFFVVDEIPLTHNGKVDRRALLELDGIPLATTEDYVAARTGTEEFLCRLWTETLSVPQVGIHDNFFALGGDSIQGFLISAGASREGIGLSATQVFMTPTVAETAAFLEEHGRDGTERADAAGLTTYTATDEQLAAVRESAVDPDEVETAYPLTQMQRGMLFHSLLDPGSGVYFEQFIYSLDGKLDLDAYQRAWQHVVNRHEILRAWIAMSGLEEPLQVVQRTAGLEWTNIDLSSYDAAEQGELLQKYLDDDRRRGFGYGQPPLFRLCLFRLGVTRFKLVMSYHHLILDAWSLFVLLRDSLEIYHAYGEGRTPQLEQARSFGDYVAFLENEDAVAARNYWLDRLAGFDQPTVIGKSARLGLSASSQEMHAEARLDLGKELTERLLAYGRANQLTLNSLVQGAWAVVVAGCSGQRDICFGITITHRPVGLADVENMVGIFINSLPMRIQLDADQPIGRWLHQVQRTQVAARAHDHYPLPLIQQNTDLPSGQPLFESLLIFENFPRSAGWTGRGGVQVHQERYIGWTNYPFAIEAMPEEQLFFQVKYDLAFFDPESVDRILSAFRDVLTAIADGGREPVGKFTAHIMADRPVSAQQQPAENAFPARGKAVPPTVMTAPGSNQENALARIWAQALHLDEVDVRTSFLALGGSSLAAMRLVILAQEAGFHFTLGDLFTPHGTVERLAARPDSFPDELLVTIRPAGPEQMVLVHPVGGHLLGYRDLVDALPDRFSVYGLQSPPAGQLPASLAELAELHASALSGIPGPVHLLGWSMGGVLATEIARLLMAMDTAPHSLTLVDSFVSAPGSAGLDEATVASGFFGDYLGQSDPATAIDPVPPGEPDPFGYLAERHLPGRSVPALRESYDRYRALRQMMLAHTPRRFPQLAHTLVVSATHQPADAFPGLLPVRLLPGDLLPDTVEFATLPETHYSIVRAAAADAIVRLLPAG